MRTGGRERWTDGRLPPTKNLHTQNTHTHPKHTSFAVDSASLPPEWKTFFLNANDFSNEGCGVA